MFFVSNTRQMSDALVSLVAEDAISLPLLASAALPPLLAAAETLSYCAGRRVIGSGAQAVHQDFDICLTPPKANPLWNLAAELEEHLTRALEGLRPTLIAGRLALNDMVVQRYHSGSFGITAHRDHARYINLVALIQLSGDGRFYTSDTRSGFGAREVYCQPGYLLLMRAPGFAGRKYRPFHNLSDVKTERYSVGLRHDTKAV